MMCSVNCDGCYAKNHCDVVPNSMNCQEVREDAEKEQRIRADERENVLNEAISRISDLRENEYDERDEAHNYGINRAIAELEQMKGEQT